jgi:hypothetical protein
MKHTRKNEVSQSKDCKIVLLMKILFLNHLRSQCGVYWYGFRLWNIWRKSEQHEFDYKEISTLQHYQEIHFKDYDVIIYNYHPSTMPWLSSITIQKQVKNVGIWHEILTDNMFDLTLDIPSQIPRPIFEDIPTTISTKEKDVIEFIEYQKDGVPIIGSFGFGFHSKGFDKIITYTCQQFQKAIIKIIMPIAQYGDKDGQLTKTIREQCKSLLTNPEVELYITHKFISDEDMLYFLNKNTINVFLYDQEKNRGISSVIDYAISVDTPLCISNSFMFRHMYDDCISITKKTIKECIDQDLTYLRTFREKWSHTNNVAMIDNYLKKHIANEKISKMKGVFYNSNRNTILHQLGLELYQNLIKSTFYEIEYTEIKRDISTFDFLIINYHSKENNWIQANMIHNFKGQSFCIVSENTLTESLPIFYDHYFVLQQNINQTYQIHPISVDTFLQKFETLLLH